MPSIECLFCLCCIESSLSLIVSIYSLQDGRPPTTTTKKNCFFSDKVMHHLRYTNQHFWKKKKENNIHSTGIQFFSHNSALEWTTEINVIDSRRCKKKNCFASIFQFIKLFLCVEIAASNWEKFMKLRENWENEVVLLIKGEKIAPLGDSQTKEIFKAKVCSQNT